MSYSSFFTFVLLVFTTPLRSNPIESGFCSPYFASIKASRANLHVGPGKEYRTVMCYVFKTYPVMVTAKYDHWRRIVDIDGTEGWIHKSMLSKNRYVIVRTDNAAIYKNPENTAPKTAYLKQNVVLELLDVKDYWCKVKKKYMNSTYEGWLPNETVFGILSNEGAMRQKSLW